MPVLSLARAARHSKCTEKESIWDSREESVGGRARKSKRKALGVHPDRKLNDIHRFYKYNTVLDSSERSSRPRNTRAVSLPARSRLHASTELLGVRVVPSVGGRNSLNTRALYSMELESSPKGTRRSCRQRTGGSVVTKTRTVRM